MKIVLVPALTEAFSCLDDSGNFADYFAALKGNGGSDVHFHGASSSGHFTASTDMGSSSSAIVRTVGQLYGNFADSFAYALYNDEDPSGSTSSTRAHSKGVILFDGSKGFWLVHSFPKWPAAKESGYQGMPSTTYGQSFLCMSFSISELEDIAKIQLVQWPQIYSSGVSSDLQSSLPNFVNWINGGKTSQSSITTQLRTTNGRYFTSYGKSKECDCNLYDELVAPGVGGDLWVETWQNGATYLKMPNFCKTDGYAHNIQNVREVQFRDGRSWSETADHAKWAVSDAAARSACIGDINRQTSQAKRGGGTVCYNSQDLWSAFTEIISVSNTCGVTAFQNTSVQALV